MREELKTKAASLTKELIEKASLQKGDLVVVGCSTSEVLGQKIGTFSSEETAGMIFEGIYAQLQAEGIELAAQCCEHLNRALILERRVAEKLGLEIVNVVPQPKAGGSFATCAYKTFKAPCAVEKIGCAKAGMDIGDTFIGMHIRPVCVPLRLSENTLGYAHVTFARSRPKFIGGERAHYDDTLK